MPGPGQVTLSVTVPEPALQSTNEDSCDFQGVGWLVLCIWGILPGFRLRVVCLRDGLLWFELEGWQLNSLQLSFCPS